MVFGAPLGLHVGCKDVYVYSDTTDQRDRNRTAVRDARREVVKSPRRGRLSRAPPAGACSARLDIARSRDVQARDRAMSKPAEDAPAVGPRRGATGGDAGERRREGALTGLVFLERFHQPLHAILLDFERCSAVDATAVSSLMGIRRLAPSARLVLCCMSAEMLRMLDRGAERMCVVRGIMWRLLKHIQAQHAHGILHLDLKLEK